MAAIFRIDFGRKRLIVSGWILYAAVYAGFAFATQQASLWVLFLVYGIYFGLAEGAEKALVADLVRPEQRGTAYGLYNLAFGVTVFPASLLMGMIWDWKGPAVAFLVSAVMGATAAMLLLILSSRIRNKKGLLNETRVLTPHPGLATGIGYYLSGMEEVRGQVVAAVKDDSRRLDRQARVSRRALDWRPRVAHRRSGVVLDADGGQRPQAHGGRQEHAVLGRARRC
jgi:MFS family permease